MRDAVGELPLAPRVFVPRGARFQGQWYGIRGVRGDSSASRAMGHRILLVKSAPVPEDILFFNGTVGHGALRDLGGHVQGRVGVEHGHVHVALV